MRGWAELAGNSTSSHRFEFQGQEVEMRDTLATLGAKYFSVDDPKYVDVKYRLGRRPTPHAQSAARIQLQVKGQQGSEVRFKCGKSKPHAEADGFAHCRDGPLVWVL